MNGGRPIDSTVDLFVRSKDDADWEEIDSLPVESLE
jgi:hypothetical protein